MSGLPGDNAAREILKDFKRRRRSRDSLSGHCVLTLQEIARQDTSKNLEMRVKNDPSDVKRRFEDKGRLRRLNPNSFGLSFTIPTLKLDLQGQSK